MYGYVHYIPYIMENKTLNTADVFMKNWFEMLFGVVITIFTPLD